MWKTTQPNIVPWQLARVHNVEKEQLDHHIQFAILLS